MFKLIGTILMSAALVGIAQAVTTDVSAPEIDPASAISGMTLLLGSLSVLRGRRAK